MILDTRILGFHSDRFISLHQNVYKSNGRCATNKYFQIIGSIHDIESYFRIDNTSSLNAQIFFCHFGHLAIIFGAGASLVFHIGWNGDFSRSLKNPIPSIPIAHGIGDPHFGNPISEAYSSGKSYYRFILSFSGIYNWLYTVGFNTVFDLYNFVITHEFLGVTLIRIGNLHLIYSCQFTQSVALNQPTVKRKRCAQEASFTRRGSLGLRPITFKTLRLDRILVKKLALHIKVHPIFIWPCKFFVAYFDCLRLTFITKAWPILRSTSIIIAPLSGGWSAHLVREQALAARYPADLFSGLWLKLPPHFAYAFYTGDWLSYSRILTFLGGLKSNTSSLYITDIAHHHFGVALLFLWQHALSSSLYKALLRLPLSVAFLWAFGLEVHLQLSLALCPGGGSMCVVGTSLTPLTPYLYLSYDYLTTTALDLHHSSIALCYIVGSFAHGGIFFIREIREKGELGPMAYISRIRATQALIGRILAHKGGIISHLT